MATLIPYLVFSGNCREALEFYATVFKDEIVSIQIFGKAPIDFPDASKNRILTRIIHSTNNIKNYRT